MFMLTNLVHIYTIHRILLPFCLFNLTKKNLKKNEIMNEHVCSSSCHDKRHIKTYSKHSDTMIR